MRILWVSRHYPTDEQHLSLEEIMQERIDFVVCSQSVPDAKVIIPLMKQYECDDVVVVLPLNILSDLCSLGVKPIRARMDRNVKPTGDTTYKHATYERILKADVLFEQLEKGEVNGRNETR